MNKIDEQKLIEINRRIIKNEMLKHSLLIFVKFKGH